MRVVKLMTVPESERERVRLKIRTALAKSPEADKWLDFFDEHCYGDRITCYVVQKGEEYLPAIIMYADEIEDCPMLWVSSEHNDQGCAKALVDHVGIRCLQPDDGSHKFWTTLGFRANSEGRWIKCHTVQ